ncbi:MAG: prephenate dehydratase [Synechococcales bacterium]|nr:prephenate dehydratase [Cyanobacteria bacterium REEB444]MEB3124861.1 prephenate dehydratase [Synechococcales bacterium]
MIRSIAHLGPAGTYAEVAALTWANQLTAQQSSPITLCAYPTIASTLHATHGGETDLTIVPVENSLEGSVPMTLDTLWQLDSLQIQHALIMPITHALISHAENLDQVQRIYSHPQALGQCQGWLGTYLPMVQIIPTHSTTEALEHLNEDTQVGIIASQRASYLYNVPILRYPINDSPDNCTKFWVVGLQCSPGGSHTSLAFSLQANVPGALVKPLQIFAEQGINMSRIESRPTKRSLGDYVFFIDLESNGLDPNVESTLRALGNYTEVIKVFGSYNTCTIHPPSL